MLRRISIALPGALLDAHYSKRAASALCSMEKARAREAPSDLPPSERASEHSDVLAIALRHMSIRLRAGDKRLIERCPRRRH